MHALWDIIDAGLFFFPSEQPQSVQMDAMGEVDPTPLLPFLQLQENMLL